MLIIFLFFGILMVLGIPVAISIGVSAIIAMAYYGYPLMIIGQKMITGIDSFLLVAVPMFILAGELMNIGKVTDRLFSFARSVVGWIPGGLGHANIFANVIFAGMSGSAIADAGGLGTVEIKAMRENGFDDEFSGSIAASASVIGPIIPPSIPMVIYGSIAQVSVGKLFLGGIIPGVMMAVALMALVCYYAIKRNYPRDQFSLALIGQQFVRGFLPLMAPAIIIGGLLTGWFTPTEASCIAVFYALFLGVVVYRQIGWKAFYDALYRSTASSANVLFIIGISTIFSFIMASQGLTDQIASLILSITNNKWVILTIINIILLFLGCIMEPGAILIMMLPILLPIVNGAGIDLIHFGVVMVLNLMIGQATPPFGMCLFTIAQVGGIKLEKLSKTVIPFIIPLVVVLFLITYLPTLVTWTPNFLMK
jgi:tripartite ATP-independent transporter DctM subunit